MSSKIEVIRGDDLHITATFKDNDGVAIDITGYTVFFTVKREIDLSDSDDSDAVISKTVTSHVTPASGITLIELTDTDTDINEGDYTYDFQLKDGSGLISSTRRGVFSVIQDVTKRTS